MDIQTTVHVEHVDDAGEPPPDAIRVTITQAVTCSRDEAEQLRDLVDEALLEYDQQRRSGPPRR